MAYTETTNGGESSGSEYLDAPGKEAKRIHRGLDSFMHVEQASVGEYRVHSGSGSTYRVDLLEGSCTCPDAEQSAMCKHMVRVVAITGETPLSAGEDTVSVTLTAAAFDEVSSAVQVLDNGEAIVAAFERSGTDKQGVLTEQQCADAADAVETMMGMSGPMGVDSPSAAADARESLRNVRD